MSKKAEGDTSLKKKFLSAVIILAIILSGFLGWVYWNRFQEIFQLQGEIYELREERKELHKKISSLEDRLELRNDIGYIEELAREELGLTVSR